VETACSSETSANSYQTIRSNIQKHSTLWSYSLWISREKCRCYKLNSPFFLCLLIYLHFLGLLFEIIDSFSAPGQLQWHVPGLSATQAIAVLYTSNCRLQIHLVLSYVCIFSNIHLPNLPLISSSLSTYDVELCKGTRSQPVARHPMGIRQERILYVVGYIRLSTSDEWWRRWVCL
jgi:hypothetical protein